MRHRLGSVPNLIALKLRTAGQIEGFFSFSPLKSRKTLYFVSQQTQAWAQPQQATKNSFATESILFSPSEFIETLIALVPIPRFHLTRYYGVFANRSQFRSKLPDMPEPPVNPQLGVINDDNKQNASDMDGNKSGKSGKRSRGKHYVTWAALLRRTFGVDVLQCPKCKSHMSLVAVVSDARTIAATLTGIGVSPRAPPIASACGTGVFGYVDAEPMVEWDD